VLGSRAVAMYTLEFYEDENGDEPVRRWIREELTPTQRYELGQAMREQLQEKGVAVCATEYGKQLGLGLFEFRLRRSVEEVGERIAAGLLPRVRQQGRAPARGLRQGRGLLCETTGPRDRARPAPARPLGTQAHLNADVPEHILLSWLHPPRALP
jgi:hypothetical protein